LALKAGGAAHIHYYTMNKAPLTQAAVKALRV
jgi:hypothetical protein